MHTCQYGGYLQTVELHRATRAAFIMKCLKDWQWREDKAEEQQLWVEKETIHPEKQDRNKMRKAVDGLFVFSNQNYLSGHQHQSVMVE